MGQRAPPQWARDLADPDDLVQDTLLQTFKRIEGGGLAGTPLYLAPEVLAGGRATVRSDIYSLGVVLYHMLTGSFPVRAASLRELRAARENSARTPLRARRPDLPKGQTRVIERAIHRDTAARYESAAALARDLRAVLPLPLRTKVVRGGIAAALLAALAVSVATGLFLKRDPVLRPSPPRELTRLTFGPGLQTDVAWSADGQQIAYASNWAGNMNIWVQPVSGGEPTRLTSSREADTQPAWSPDARSIAFRSERDGGGLFVMSLESGTTRKLTSFGYLPAWSPDGRTVSFYKGVPSGISNGAFVVPADGSKRPVFPWPIGGAAAMPIAAADEAVSWSRPGSPPPGAERATGGATGPPGSPRRRWPGAGGPR